MSKILEQMPDLGGPAQPSLAPTTDIGMMARFITAANVPPAGNNFEQWKDARFETALDTLSNETDPAIIQASYRAANERLVDDPPWLYIVHDMNPRAFSKRVHGFVPAQSSLTDLTLVSVQ
jgi:peptide/nickel transport system substrate-binding protein